LGCDEHYFGCRSAMAAHERSTSRLAVTLALTFWTHSCRAVGDYRMHEYDGTNPIA